MRVILHVAHMCVCMNFSVAIHGMQGFLFSFTQSQVVNWPAFCLFARLCHYHNYARTKNIFQRDNQHNVLSVIKRSLDGPTEKGQLT